MEKKCKIIYLNNFIYILNEDEIKEGDWFIGDNISIKQCTLNNGGNINFKGGWYSGSTNCKKIIATTDTSLNYIEHDDTVPYPKGVQIRLPQPSQQFTTKYIEEYNKGNVITDVLVEYEQDYTNRNCSTCSLGTDGTCELNLEKKCCSSTNNVTKHGDYWISCLDGEEDSEIYKIKVNPKDSTINIKKLKDSWNREEIIEQMWLAYKAANTVFKDESALRIEFDNWIDQNL